MSDDEVEHGDGAEADFEDDVDGFDMEELSLGHQPTGDCCDDHEEQRANSQVPQFQGELRMGFRQPGEQRDEDRPPPSLIDNDDIPAEFKAPSQLRPGASHRTGPKGVKADYQHAKYNLMTAQMREKMYRERQMHKKANGEEKFDVPEAVDPHAQQKSEKELQKQKRKQMRKKGDDSSDSDLSSDSEDEAFLKYRMAKMKAIQDDMPTFGAFERVTVQQMAQAVKAVHELTWVVIHVYQNHVPACVKMNLVLEDLAPQFEHVHFLRIRSKEAMPNFDDIGLPLILAYRGGKQIHSFLRVHEAMGKGADWMDRDLVQFLAQYNILSKPMVGVSQPKEVTSSAPRSIKSSSRAFVADDEDDDGDRSD